ncbi:class I SAM-dependent methyltransferase [Paraburkholderia caribensis]|uniref:class I SAM-dependent methyltransferase n=1 Tax=Paraburkholderia caribensis TaxID=75105 RepID=UPI0034D32B42
MQKEQFQPIAVTAPDRHPLLFKLRCYVDVQLGSIVEYLRPALGLLKGTVLDVGAGESPWRGWLSKDAKYFGIDIGNATEFGMSSERNDITYYDGRRIPFEDAHFDNAICIEVLEHAQDPKLLLSEIARVLKPRGVLLLTVPWSARRHHIPHDYHRFTRERLEMLFAEAGFVDVTIQERGSDIGAIANKLTVLTIRLINPARKWDLLWTAPLAALCLPLAAVFLFASNVANKLGRGAMEDPLGYFVRAVR